MKAAVLHTFGGIPLYEDFPDPVLQDGEIFLQVRAVALENIDRAMAAGTHFSSQQFLPQLPALPGTDGIGLTADGRLVGFGGMRPPYGSLAEKVAVPGNYTVPIPEGVDAAIAAAVPGSTLTALFPLKWGASLQAGETVLINGATGFAGKLAIQVAKLLGAGRVVGSGRNAASLRALVELGVDEVIDLKQSDEDVVAAYKQAAGSEGYHVILDFLWGHPTELLLSSLIPKELGFARHKVRLIQAGEMAGPTLALPAAALRTSGLEILGAGAGLTPEAIGEGASMVWEWIKAGQITADIEQVPLAEIEQAWRRTDVHGKRLVIVP